jgi:putative acetyltransferase
VSAGWLIRPERPGDEMAISRVIGEAFARAEHSDGTEARIVERLGASGLLTVSLVAERDGIVVGHVAFSPVEVSDGSDGWFGLGPVAVAPDRQGAGIGTALIEQGLDQLRRSGAGGCVVLGEPGYYGRFGFRHDPALVYPGPPPEYFQCQVLNGEPARGEVRYAPAFG